MTFAEQSNDGTERITTRTVDFARAFALGKPAEVYPAGRYDVEIIEHRVDAGGHTALVRKSTTLIIRTATGMRCREIHARELDQALLRDADQRLKEPSENPDRENPEVP